MKPSRNLANFSSVLELFRVIGHVPFFLSVGTLSKKKKKNRKEEKKECGDLGESVKVGRTAAAHCRSIRFSVCVELTRPSLWTLSAALLFLSSRITASRTFDTAPAARDTRENCSGGVTKKKEVRNAEKHPTLLPFLPPPPFSLHPSPLAGISFKCQTVHLEQLTQTLRGGGKWERVGI